MRIAVTGSRGLTVPVDSLRYLFGYFVRGIGFTVLVGDCPTGADAAARDLCRSPNSPAIEIFPADWETHGRAAGPIRNKQMIERADALVGYWDGRSRGAGGTIDLARKKGIPMLIVELADYNLS